MTMQTKYRTQFHCKKITNAEKKNTMAFIPFSFVIDLALVRVKPH
jgi:hypothetical protein